MRRRAWNHGRLALAVLAVAVTGFPAASQLPVSPQETERLTKAVTPAYIAPYPEFSPDWQPLPLRLVGVDLAQNGEQVSGDRPVLDSSFPLTVTCYWLAESEVSQKRGLELRLASHDGQIARAEEVKAGPDAVVWYAGSVYQQSFELALNPAAAMITGDATLSLSLFPRQQPSTSAVPLQRVPLYLSPSLRPGRVSARSLSSAIAGDYHDLSVSFRLGRSARQNVQAPAETRRPTVAVAVVSAVAYGSVPQGEAVCEVVVRSHNAQPQTWPLISGVDTARSDFDFYPAGSVNHQKAKIVESWDAEYPDVFNNPFMKHKYLAIFPLPAEARNVASLEFISKTSFVLDVFDVVLIQTEQESLPAASR